MEHKHTNRLAQAGSPYLLQHAHNPVDWYEWSEEAWERAQAEDKPVLVSIGYSACHWCHVMERESFENTDTAALMNEYFVCIKVDREERPDVDQVYMDAVQLITGRGGWPLNMFCLPDGRPLHGGTYFPNREWNQLLFQLHDFYTNRKPEALEFAQKLTDGVQQMDVMNAKPAEEQFTAADMDAIFALWKPQIDWEEGGNARVPKFPMPVNFEFLLSYHLLSGDKEALDAVNLTLTKMAYGGIYDQLGGGFARYSVDGVWLALHFEKMLYDNGQLVSLYANAHKTTGNPLYKKIIDETLAWVKNEMTDASGGFYSALDADSEGEEGKFYVWRKDELQILLGKDEALFSEYYNVIEAGNWEHGNNILHVKESIAEFARWKGLSEENVSALISRCNEKLKAARDKRIRPGLDDKIICSWNALMLKGYADAYLATGNSDYLEAAIKSADFIKNKLYKNGRLLRIYKNGKSSINAFLEDYACLVDALIGLYQCSFDEAHLLWAKELTDNCINEFFDAEKGIFYFTSKNDAPLAARKTDTGDDVIPSGNGIMACSLYKLAYYFGELNYKEMADTMLAKMAQQVKKYPSWYSRWAQCALFQAYGLYQVVIVGENSDEIQQQFTRYIPNAVFAVSKTGESRLSLFEGRYTEGKTQIYICKNETCNLPVTDYQSAIKLLSE